MATFTNFFGGAFFGGGFFGAGVDDAPAQGGGGGTPAQKPYGRLPQYYSKKAILDYKRVELPQEPVSNRVAIQVLDQAAKVWNRFEGNDSRLGDMLAKVATLERQIAVYVEGREIYNIVTELKQRIQARKDAKDADDEEIEINEMLDEGLL